MPKDWLTNMVFINIEIPQFANGKDISDFL